MTSSSSRIRHALWCLTTLASLSSCAAVPVPAAEGASARDLRDARHVLRVRVYADDSYRSETLEWRGRLTRQVADVNVILLDRFGARVEVTDVVEWSHDASTQELNEVLAELRVREPSPDVDRVLALTGELTAHTDAQHQLGLSEILGQYLVVRRVRGHATRRHKEATVLLHELAHTLGGLHTREPGHLMSVTYARAHRGFTQANTRAISRALELHTADPHASHATWRAAALIAVRAVVDDDALGARELRADARDLFTPRPPDSLTSAEVATLDAARVLLSSDRSAESLDTLSGLREARPEHPAVALLTCAALERERIAGRPDDISLIAWCERARSTSPDDTHASLLLASAYIRAARPLDALTVTTHAEDALTRRPDPSTNDWLLLSGLYATLGVHSGADRTLTRAGLHRDAPALRDVITARRDYYALTSDLEPDLEVAVWPLIQTLEGALQRQDAFTRKATLTTLQELAPGRPPTLLATCRVDYARRAFKRAARTCRAATTAAPDSSNAHYNLGIALAARSDLSGATRSLETAVALNPDIDSYWSALASILTARKRRRQVEALREAHVEHFGGRPDW